MQNSDKTEKVIFNPQFFSCALPEEMQAFKALAASNNVTVQNSIASQIEDLVACLFPQETKSGTPKSELIEKWLDGRKIESLGNMVYFPWKNAATQVLGAKDFSTTRTNRNKIKVPGEIQDELAKKNVLFIGLSVGQSAALTFAMQRLCGHFHLVDFDELSLSNMNRLRASVLDIDLPKTTIAARQIAEQDPYLQVSCYPEGATRDNLDQLITMNGTGKVDLIVEECDSLDIKILVRQAARKHGVPVIMDTSDRGLVDVERYDQNPTLPLFHNLVPEAELEAFLANPDPALRFQLLTKIVDLQKVSQGMRDSLPLLQTTLLTWPQLAYEVTLGGALMAFVGYKILAGKEVKSGRIYVDLEEIFKDGGLWT